MTALSDRYDYPAFFHPEQAPLWLAAVAAALGRPGPEDDSAVCEIGCGQGFGLCLLAAANPARRPVGPRSGGALLIPPRPSPSREASATGCCG